MLAAVIVVLEIMPMLITHVKSTYCNKGEDYSIHVRALTATQFFCYSCLQILSHVGESVDSPTVNHIITRIQAFSYTFSETAYNVQPIDLLNRTDLLLPRIRKL